MRWVLLLGAISTIGCRNLDRFDTQGGGAYCGDIVPGQFVRETYPRDMRLELELDMAALNEHPGSITSRGAAPGECRTDIEYPEFHRAKLRAIPKLEHDPLSEFEFGDARAHNFMAWVDSTCGRTSLAVVSLMRNDEVEIRLLTPGPEAATDAVPTAFGLFPMTRHSNDCGF